MNRQVRHARTQSSEHRADEAQNVVRAFAGRLGLGAPVVLPCLGQETETFFAQRNVISNPGGLLDMSHPPQLIERLLPTTCVLVAFGIREQFPGRVELGGRRCVARLRG